MWEKPRIDGKKKLKHNAVPTIFPTVQKEKENKKNPHTFNPFNPYTKYNVQDTQERSIQFSFDAIAATSKSDVNETTLEPALLQIEELKRKLKEANEKLQIADTVLYKTEKTKKILLQQIRKLKSQKRLRIEKSLLKSSEILRKVFNNDQIEWLQKDSPIRGVYKWSEETIRKVLRLKFCCSEKGYKELIA